MQDTTQKRAILVIIFVVGLVAGVALSAIAPAHDNPQTAGAPQPIAEIVVEPSAREESMQIFIYTASPDADNWVRENAGEYGSLWTPEDLGRRYFTLLIDNTYRRMEVIEHIRTMGTGLVRYPRERYKMPKVPVEPIWVEPQL